jgi:hypothetical protein
LDGLAWEGRQQKWWFATFSAQGWPLLALWYGEFESDQLDGGWLLSREVQPGYIYYNRALAFRPIWPGFAINTVFYALVLWLLVAAPFALRRRSRIKRGLCPKCAYDLRGAALQNRACPECGCAGHVE